MEVIIIAEGPDGSGKTTLAKHIAKELGLEYRRPPETLLSSTHGPSKDLPQWWAHELARSPQDRREGVYDRCFYISEPIYQMAQVQRDLLVSGLELSRGLHDLWVENPILIFCLPPMEQQYSNVIRDGRESLAGLTNRHLEKINFMYWAWYGMWQNVVTNCRAHNYVGDPDHKWALEWVREAL